MAVAGVLHEVNTEEKNSNSLFLKIQGKIPYSDTPSPRNLELPVIVTCRAYNAFIQYLKPLRAVLRQHWEVIIELV